MGTKKKVASKKTVGEDKRLSRERITKKQMRFTQAEVTAAVKKAAAIFEAKKMPVVITALHPEGFVSSRVLGLPEFLPMLSVQAEIACKETAVSIAKADKSTIKGMGEACDHAEEVARPERARLRGELIEALGLKNEEEENPLAKLMEMLTKASQDPNAKVSVFHMPMGEQKEKTN